MAKMRDVTGIRTEDGYEIILSDKTRSITVKTPDGQKIVLGDDGNISITGYNGNRITVGGDDTNIHSNNGVGLSGKKITVSDKGGASITLSGGVVTIAANQINLEGSIHFEGDFTANPKIPQSQVET